MKMNSRAFARFSTASVFALAILLASMALLAAPVSALANEAGQQTNRQVLSVDNEAVQGQDGKDVQQGRVITIKTAAQWHNIGNYKGGTFKLGKNINLTSTSQYLVINKNYTYTIDLNGYKVATTQTVNSNRNPPLSITRGTVIMKSSKGNNKGVLYSKETAAIDISGGRFYLKSGVVYDDFYDFRYSVAAAIHVRGTGQCHLNGGSVMGVVNGVFGSDSAKIYTTGAGTKTFPYVRAGVHDTNMMFTHYGSAIQIISANVTLSLQGGSFGTKATPDYDLPSVVGTYTYTQSGFYPVLDTRGKALKTAKGYRYLDAKGNAVKIKGSNLNSIYPGLNIDPIKRLTTNVKSSDGYYTVYVALTPAEEKARKAAAAEKAKLKANSVPVYWVVCKKTGENMYTTDRNEVNVLCKKQRAWINRGIVFYAPKKTSKPVYRLFSPKLNDHHYTTDKHEVIVLTKKQGWKLDLGGKAMWYSGGKARTYRMCSPARANAGKAGTHRFATTMAQVKNLKKYGWRLDDVKLYANLI